MLQPLLEPMSDRGDSKGAQLAVRESAQPEHVVLVDKLNSGLFGPVPDPVLNIVFRFLRDRELCIFAECARRFSDRASAAPLWHLRLAAAHPERLHIQFDFEENASADEDLNEEQRKAVRLLEESTQPKRVFMKYVHAADRFHEAAMESWKLELFDYESRCCNMAFAYLEGPCCGLLGSIALLAACVLGFISLRSNESFTTLSMYPFLGLLAFAAALLGCACVAHHSPRSCGCTPAAFRNAMGPFKVTMTRFLPPHHGHHMAGAASALLLLLFAALFALRLAGALGDLSWHVVFLPAWIAFALLAGMLYLIRRSQQKPRDLVGLWVFFGLVPAIAFCALLLIKLLDGFGPGSFSAWAPLYPLFVVKVFFLLSAALQAVRRWNVDDACNCFGLLVLMGLPVSFEIMLAVYLDSRVSALSYNKIFVPLWIILGDFVIGFCVILTMTMGENHEYQLMRCYDPRPLQPSRETSEVNARRWMEHMRAMARKVQWKTAATEVEDPGFRYVEHPASAEAPPPDYALIQSRLAQARDGRSSSAHAVPQKPTLPGQPHVSQ